MIGKHRAELLVERYRFNMGLLMGECGAQGQPLPGAPTPLDPESQLFAVGCPGPSCCIAVPQPTRRRGDVLPCPPRGQGCGWQPPVVPCARDGPGARAASSCWLRRPASAALAEAPRAGLCPSPTGCPVRRGGAEPAAVGGWEDHQERGGPAGGLRGQRVRCCSGWCPMSVPCPVWDLLACPMRGPGAGDSLPWVGAGRVRGVTAGQGHLQALGHREPFLLLSVSLFSRCCICWDQRQKLTWKRNQR